MAERDGDRLSGDHGCRLTHVFRRLQLAAGVVDLNTLRLPAFRSSDHRTQDIGRTIAMLYLGGPDAARRGYLMLSSRRLASTEAGSSARARSSSVRAAAVFLVNK